MISFKDAEELLQKEYHTDNFLFLLKELLPDYKKDNHETAHSSTLFSNVTQLGVSKICDITIYEVGLVKGVEKRRVAITQDMFRVLRGQGINNALVAFYNEDRRNYRLSLLTSHYEFEGDKIVKVLSNPHRFSYTLGYGTKTRTACKFLIEKGKVESLEDLVSRFSVEVVNKQFYSEIANCFSELVGGEREGKTFHRQLNLYGVVDQNKYSEFAVRLIGRIVFCWFLKEKKSSAGISLIPAEFLSLASIVPNYYHLILEPLFFELLNTKQTLRKGKYAKESIYKQIPYLNGGLFSPHGDDHYKYDPALQCGKFGVVTIPDDWFIRLYSVLDQYNFTVDENTSYDIELSIDPEMLGRIFENLLAEINPETGENAKKSTGSFYTPRDIVDYMVDNSLLEYLKEQTHISELKLRALISYSKEDDNLANFTNQEKKQIINSLYTITVLDPACGSGAFPIGILQKVVYILQEVDPDANLWFDKATENWGDVFLKKEFEKKFNAGSLDYIRKLKVIQNSIFGVDIQPIAVEIARLRCFLSLIIEEAVNDDEPNRGVNPLPNLDFKFVVANTLLKLQDDVDINMGKKYVQQSLFENVDYVSALKALRDEYFTAEQDRRTELKFEFANLQKKMWQEASMNFGNMLTTTKYRKLSSWAPFDNDGADWFDAEWMFGVKDGFDIVIGNPPYIQLQKSIDAAHKIKLGDMYDGCGFETFAKTGDIYCLFYEQGVNLLKEKGILTYITSNKWMRAGYGEKLRKFLSRFNPVNLIDFAGQKVFESATVDVNILICKKEQNQGKTNACIADENCKNNMSVFVAQNSTVSSFNTSDGWVILSPIEQSIKAKIEKVGTPLKDWNISINYGVKTGFNDAFIIDGATRRDLIAKDPKSAEIIRPILRGRDIKRYGYDFADLWLIATFPSKKYDIDDYPAIKKHLLSFGKERLEQSGETHIINGQKVVSRKKTTNKWFETQDSISYWDDFSKQKIMYSEIVQSPQFIYDESGLFPEATVFIMSGEYVDYLCCILNSRIYAYIFKTFYAGGGLGENGYRYKKAFILNLPIVKPNSETLMFVRSFLNEARYKILHDDMQMEYFIAKQFLLSDDEISLILNNSKF